MPAGPRLTGRAARGAAGVNTGQIISGAGHLALIGWALIGGVFQSAPPPFEVVQATAISEEEFAAIMDRESAPDAVADVDTPEPPAPGETAPSLSSEADTPPESAQPDASATPPPDPAPDVSPRPQPRPAARVAPEAVARPEPDVRVDDVASPEVTPDEGAESAEEPSEATAPEEAATEIVTEAEEPAQAAPTASVRPRTRPARPEATAEAPPEDTPQPETPATDQSAVNDALAAALGQAQQTSQTPSGPPLTGGEKDALRVSVQRCWNVGSLSSEALRTTVVVGVQMAETGKPEIGSIRMLSATGGGDAAAKQAFEAARRAIIRCGNDGFNLPVEKYDHWRDIEMTFNPEKMRIK